MSEYVFSEMLCGSVMSEKGGGGVVHGRPKDPSSYALDTGVIPRTTSFLPFQASLAEWNSGIWVEIKNRHLRPYLRRVTHGMVNFWCNVCKPLITCSHHFYLSYIWLPEIEATICYSFAKLIISCSCRWPEIGLWLETRSSLTFKFQLTTASFDNYDDLLFLFLCDS